MNKRIRLFIGFLLIFISVSAQKQSSNWQYHFPLDIEPRVSGSFGEIRSNHFHSGLDLTTNGEIGLPVYCADKGYVSRIAVSSNGFGKALYVAHSSGYTTVYAHLDGFSSSLDSLVTAIQYDNKSFSFNKYFESGHIKVDRGEVIGYSGNSGSSGGPHLHFEVRETNGQRPIDPLAFLTPVKDDIRPHIAGIQIYPLSDDATVNGQSEPVYYPAVFYEGAFHLKHSPDIVVTGKIGVGIEVIDYYSGSWRKCGVHSIDLRLEDKLLYNYTMDGFFFRDTRYLNSHIDYAFRKNENKTIQKSFLDPYNKLDVYTTGENRGIIRVDKDGTIQLKYTIEDILGNESTLAFSVQGKRGEIDEKVPTKTQMIDASQPFEYKENSHSVSFPEGSFYNDIPENFEVSSSEESLSGTVFHILDETIPVHKWFEIKIPVDSNIMTEGLCGARFSKNGKKDFVDGQTDGSFFVLKAREGGKYGLLRDTVSPSISLMNRPPQLDYSGRNELRVKIKDDFAGIDDYTGTINGQWALFDYDAKNDQIICFFHKVPFLEKGKKHRLIIEAVDKAGNSNKLETMFRY